MKVCLKCGVPKDESEFHNHKQGRDGLHPWCKLCLAAYMRDRYLKIDRPKSQKPPPRRVVSPQAAHAAARNVWNRLKGTGRIPQWLRFEDVLPFYELANRFGLTVDHIYPLTSPTVSGLHVPWNLQLLTHSENAQKRRKLPVF